MSKEEAKRRWHAMLEATDADAEGGDTPEDELDSMAENDDAAVWCASQGVRLGIAANPDSIRLGRRRVVTYDAWPEWLEALSGNVVDQETVIVDWNRFIHAAGFSPCESAVFRAYFRCDINTMSGLGRECGLTPREASDYLASVLAKLSKFGGSLVSEAITVRLNEGLVYQERLASGRRSWDLAPLEKSYSEVMGSEVYSLYSQQVTQHVTLSAGISTLVTRGTMTIADLQKKLKSETAKRDRLAERAHNARIALSEAEGAVDNLTSEARREQATAAMEEREWAGAAALQSKLERAQSAVIEACSKLEAAVAALDQQGQVLVAIEEEVHFRRHELLAAALLKPREEAFAAMEQFTRMAVRLRSIAREHGFSAVPLEMLFTDYDPRSPFDGCTQRNLKTALMNVAGELHDDAKRFSKAV